MSRERFNRIFVFLPRYQVEVADFDFETGDEEEPRSFMQRVKEEWKANFSRRAHLSEFDVTYGSNDERH